jgi:hypothetical protein
MKILSIETVEIIQGVIGRIFGYGLANGFNLDLNDSN